MALRKQFDLPDGNQAEYIRIREIHLDKLKVSISLDLYKDQTSRISGKAPCIKGFSQKKFPTLPDYAFELSTLEANAYEEAYAWLKLQPGFEDAGDI